MLNSLSDITAPVLALVQDLRRRISEPPPSTVLKRPMGDRNQRRDVRVRAALPTWRLTKSAAEAVEMVEVSYRGMLLRMVDPDPVRRLIRLRVQLPSGMLNLHAEVMHVEENTWVGVRLFALNGADRDEWERYVALLIGPAAASRAA